MNQTNVNVVILSDNHLFRPLGAYRIASEIRTHGFTCQTIENTSTFSPDELKEVLFRLMGDQTLIFGISLTFFRLNYSLKRSRFTHDWKLIANLIKIARKIKPTIKVVIGSFIFPPLEFDEKIDLVVTGAGENAIIDYLKFILGKNPFFQSKVTDKYMWVDGQNYNNNTFNFASSQTIFHPSDHIQPNEALPIETARGCIFKCKFCSYTDLGKKKNDYIKNKKTLQEEFLRNYHEFGTTRYYIVDSTFNENIIKLQNLADIAQHLPFKLEYVCHLRIDLLRIHPEQYQLLFDSGLVGCNFGIESLNEKSLKAIGKGLHPDKVIEELYKIRDLAPNLGVQAGFICGLPYETKESFLNWSTRIYEKDFPIDDSSVVPLVISNINMPYISEFAIHKDRYYTWKDDVWHNGDFDFNWATHTCTNIINKIGNRKRVAGWNSILRVPPYKESITKKPYSTILPWLEKSVTGAIENYKKTLLN